MSTDFTRKELQELREILNDILRPSYDSRLEGYTLHAGNCSYNGGEVTFKLKILKDGAKTREEQDMEMMAEDLNLDTTKQAKQGNQILTIVGYRMKARKSPWIVMDVTTHKEYVTNNDFVKRLFTKELV